MLSNMNRQLLSFLNNQSLKYHSRAGVYGFKIKNATSSSPKNNWKYGGIVYSLSEAYKNEGYKIADINPLEKPKLNYIPSLDPLQYQDIDVNEKVSVNGIIQSTQDEVTVENLAKTLRHVYCGKIGIELQHLQNNEKEWMSKSFERIQVESTLTSKEQRSLLNELLKSQVFDNFLATKFTSVKRYGGEGAECMLAFFSEIFKQSCLAGLKEIVIGIPHRGRLNLLSGMLNFPPVVMFKKMFGLAEFPSSVDATGDVLSHLTSSTEYTMENKSVHVTLLPNPSHLEAISPVVVGYVRSRLQTLKVADYQETIEADVEYPVLPVQVHGDASFSGQGVVMETLAISNVPHFSVGGSIHLIVNNQIGFTTPQERGSSSANCSDLMKIIDAPVIHVNGDYPEEVLKAAKLAFDYRQKYKKDVLINMMCFRRWGHNELDDPTFTNPLMYKIIQSRKSVPDLYAEAVIANNVVTQEEVEEIASNYHNALNEQLKNADTHESELCGMQTNWKKDSTLKDSISVWDTGVPVDLLKFIGNKSVQLPENFIVHGTLLKNHIQERIKKVERGNQIDWATAEAMAFGSLVYQGHNVRISGQDVGRGTFSHRHAMLVDQSSGEMYIPLNHMSENQTAHLEVANSILSEEGVLSFEYGFNIENTSNIVIWEAQFGDFFNSAQVVFDTFISSGETKWLLPSNIVILLPHGYDGAGPEHSSCRLERFLQMCDSNENKFDSDDVNWNVANPTTPAQYFHLLRQQVVSKLVKPVVIVGPKILIRHPSAVSSLKDMSSGKNFQSVLEESNVTAQNIRSVIFCSGKHFYLLQKEKENRKLKECAIVRLEKLCPFPSERLHEVMKKYSNAQNFIWSQEEPQNMGAWTFVQSRFRNLLGCQLKYTGRNALGTPAVGIGRRHQEEVQSIIKDTFNELK